MGLPGSGKSTAVREIYHIVDKEYKAFIVEYDQFEEAIRNSEDGGFDSLSWKQARRDVITFVESTVQAHRGTKLVFLLDDNFHYKSMRKQWVRWAQDNDAALHFAFLDVPLEECMKRNSARDSRRRVPDFSLIHMAEVFESPFDAKQPWASPGPKVYSDVRVLEEAMTKISSTRGDPPHEENRRDGFWTPLPRNVAREMEEENMEQVTATEKLDCRLRRVVSCALQYLPAHLNKPSFAQRWGKQKKEMLKSERVTNEEEIDGAVQQFLSFCLEDVRVKSQNGAEEKEEARSEKKGF